VLVSLPSSLSGASSPQPLDPKKATREPERPLERELTRWRSTQTRPSWSPDGRRIAFFSNHRQPDRFDLYVLAVEGSSPPRLLVKDVLPPERHGPAWTPDGRSLVVALEQPRRLDPLVVVDVGSGVVRTLETGTVNNQEPEVGLRQGRPYLVFSAQGREGDSERMWRRIYGGFLPLE